MCIVIDTNTLPAVFNADSINHADFLPVLEWIQNGNGKVVYGGTKYQNELKNYLRLFIELRNRGKGVYIDCDLVDAKATEISKVIVDPDFDDQHIVALLIISGCKLICSLDKRAHRYFKHSKFFSPARNRPKIYKNIHHRSLLNNRNIANVCKC